MSVIRRDRPEPDHWATNYTLVARLSAESDVEIGDRFEYERDGEMVEMKVVELSDEICVLERVGSGIESYGRSVASAMNKS